MTDLAISCYCISWSIGKFNINLILLMHCSQEGQIKDLSRGWTMVTYNAGLVRSYQRGPGVLGAAGAAFCPFSYK